MKRGESRYRKTKSARSLRDGEANERLSNERRYVTGIAIFARVTSRFMAAIVYNGF